MVFWHPVDKYMLAAWRDGFGAAGMPEALQRLTFVLSEKFEMQFGIIGSNGPNKCGDVKVEQGHRVQVRRLPVAHQRETRSCSDRTDGTGRGD